MLKKTLIAMAVAGALGTSAGAFAGSGSGHTAHNEPVVTSVSAASADSAAHMSPTIEIGDGIVLSHLDDEFDGYIVADAAESFKGGAAVGATSSTSGSGTVAFSSNGRSAARLETAVADEAYLVPAPLAAFDGKRFWKVEVSPSKIEELDRLATENVYVMMPIEDAIVDPQLALTAGPDAFTHLSDISSLESASSSAS